MSAVFGADGSTTPSQASWSAVQAAREMRDLIGQFNGERASAGKATIAMSIGIASGPVFVGQAGTTRRATYVCVGATPRRAART